MDSAAPFPVVPMRNRRTSDHNRRRSLPPPLSPNRQQHSANRVHVQPASPEVISSLISTLSTLSAPPRHIFDNITSRSTPASPSASQSTFWASEYADGNSNSGFGMDYGAYSHEMNHSALDFLHPDDAAIPPVVRTSRPPSGFSQITAPQSPKTESFKSYLRMSSRPGSRPGSRGSTQDETSSIGSVSIEPSLAKVPKESNVLIATGVGPKRGRANLMYMSSKERLREQEMDRRRSSTSTIQARADGRGVDGIIEERRSYQASMVEPFPAENPITEEPTPERAEKPEKPSRLTVDLPARSSNLNPDGGSPVSPSFGGARYIPARDSSLRKSVSSMQSSKKRNSHRSSRNYDASKDVIEEDVESPRRKKRDSISKDIGGDKEGEKEKESAPAKDQDINTEKGNRIQKESEIQLDIFTNLSPFKLKSPRASLKIATPPPEDENSSGPISKNLETGEVEHSAPSPSIYQRRDRNFGSRTNSLAPKSNNVLTPSPSQHAKTSLDIHPSTSKAPTPERRLSQPTSPTTSGRHKRSFSNPLARNQPITPNPRHTIAEDRQSNADSIDDSVESFLRSPRLSQKIRHPPTGRIISFSEVGDSEGFAVFCCVGMGLTRYITAFYDELALTLKLRLITPDRPGVGDSEDYYDGTGTPLGWPDDIYAICQALKITKFSILAHSAGAIYALATALRMPQHIRGRIHLLAPWIPPSQMSRIGAQKGTSPGSVPTSQRILRALPTPILKAANSSFMSATSSSITSSLPKTQRQKRKNAKNRDGPMAGGRTTPGLGEKRETLMYSQPSATSDMKPPMTASKAADPNSEEALIAAAAMSLAEKTRQTTYDTRLTNAIWDLATTNANPAVDLLVCLERRRTIGFRYVDITRAVVIHHGSRDNRVPVENVRWLGKTMRRCEVRVLEGEGHGLMASAAVMAGVLMEIAKEWEDWTLLVQQGEKGAAAANNLRRPLVRKASDWAVLKVA
ncbi:MAG: hypothetical protein M1829_004045 [Trizodia sp. TS-e1964]|nr:MAG: hypothetical protein M1829_004045 [Trizodia sp. TS-e1964]